MSVTARRVIYGLMTAFGLALTVPFAIESRRFSSSLVQIDPWDVDAALSFAPLLRLASLSLLGFGLATGFLYLALSAGYPRAWRPRREGSLLHCERCGAEVAPGHQSCPTCDQRFAW